MLTVPVPAMRRSSLPGAAARTWKALPAGAESGSSASLSTILIVDAGAPAAVPRAKSCAIPRSWSSTSAGPPVPPSVSFVTSTSWNAATSLPAASCSRQLSLTASGS